MVELACCQVGPVSKSVIKKSLVKVGVAANEIVAHRQAYLNETSQSRVSEAVLGYVTPVRLGFKLHCVCGK